MIEANVIHAAWRSGAKNSFFTGSSCIYPRMAPQPIREEHRLTGPLEPTNEWYAVAKIAGRRSAPMAANHAAYDLESKCRSKTANS